MDFKGFTRFSFKNESVWMIIFGLLPMTIGILVLLVLMILRELT
jgi:hypothetical protein